MSATVKFPPRAAVAENNQNLVKRMASFSLSHHILSILQFWRERKENAAVGHMCATHGSALDLTSDDGTWRLTWQHHRGWVSIFDDDIEDHQWEWIQVLYRMASIEQMVGNEWPERKNRAKSRLTDFSYGLWSLMTVDWHHHQQQSYFTFPFFTTFSINDSNYPDLCSAVFPIWFEEGEKANVMCNGKQVPYKWWKVWDSVYYTVDKRAVFFLAIEWHFEDESSDGLSFYSRATTV